MNLSTNLLNGKYSAETLYTACYLQLTSNDNSVTTCTKWICEGLGIEPKAGSGRSLDTLREMLLGLEQSKAIMVNGDLDKSINKLDIRLRSNHELFSGRGTCIQVTSKDLLNVVLAESKAKYKVFACYLGILAGDNADEALSIARNLCRGISKKFLENVKTKLF